MLGAETDAALGLFSVRQFPADAAYEAWLAEQSGDERTPIDSGAAALAGWDVPAVRLWSGLGEAPGALAAAVLDTAAAVHVTVPAGVRVTVAYADADAGPDGGPAALRVAVVDGEGRTVEAVPVRFRALVPVGVAS